MAGVAEVTQRRAPLHQSGGRGAGAADGWAALAAELIAAALEDLKVPGKARNAANWICGGKAPVPFAVACELVNLDADAVRSRLRRRGLLNGKA